MSTVNKLIKGSIWNTISQGGSQVFNMAFTVIIARLLTPEDFGLFGMVVIVIAFIGYFSEFGMTACLIQRQKIDELDTNSVFWTSVAISLVLYSIMFAAAPIVSRFYHEPRLTLLTRVLFGNFLIMPFTFIPSTLETMQLRFKTQTIADLVSVIISGGVAITFAFLGFGVWSLVWQTLSMTAARAIVLAIGTRWIPKPIFSWKRVKPLLGMGVDFTANNLIQFAYDNIDYLLVGKLLGKGPLGVYTMAFRLSKSPILKIEQVFGKMVFPAFASFNDEPERIKRNFLRLVLFSMTWLMPVLIFGYFAAEPLIHILLGIKWEQAIPLIRVFMLYLIANSFCIQNYGIMASLNKVKTWNAVQLVSTLMLAITGYIGIQGKGIIGMAIAFTATTSISLIALFAATAKLLGVSFRENLKNIATILLKNAIIAGSLLGSTFLLRRWTRNDWVLLIVPGVIFAAIFFAFNARDLKKAFFAMKEALKPKAHVDSVTQEGD